MQSTDFELYDGKCYKDLIRDIVTNSENKREQIEIAIADLRDRIVTINDAIVLAPIIQTYLDTGVKNDEQLVKLLSVLQRLISSQADNEDSAGYLTEAEKDQLVKDIKNIQFDVKVPVEVKKIEKKL